MTNRSTPTRCQIEGCRSRAIRGYNIDLCAGHRSTVVEDVMTTGWGETQRCVWPGCRARCYHEIRLCTSHLTIAGKYALDDELIAHKVYELRTFRGNPDTEPATEKPAPPVGSVYFLRVGGYIKIGWTSNLDKRMRGYQPDTQLLAVMPGTRKDETHLHKRFGHLKTHGREWFPLAPQITDHIAAVVKEHGPPPAVDFSARATKRIVGPRLNRYVGGEYRGPGARRVS